MLSSVAERFSRLIQRYLPDAFIIAVLITLVVLIVGIALNPTEPQVILQGWGDGFWSYLAFTMQMVLLLMTGMTLASVPFINRGLTRLASIVKKPWQGYVLTLHEANNGPQSTYHEEKRAVHTIGYAKYIAEKGLVKYNQFQKSPNQFNAKTSKLPIKEADNRYRIGMLKSEKDDENLAIACAYVAHYENWTRFHFLQEYFEDYVI